MYSVNIRLKRVKISINVLVKNKLFVNVFSSCRCEWISRLHIYILNRLDYTDASFYVTFKRYFVGKYIADAITLCVIRNAVNV